LIGHSNGANGALLCKPMALLSLSNPDASGVDLGTYE